MMILMTGLMIYIIQNSINCSRMSHHKLRLKAGIPIMLKRNINQAASLCNGTRMRVTRLGKNSIQAIALNGSCQGKELLIKRMDMNPSENKLPFNMTRRQFPVINLSFLL